MEHNPQTAADFFKAQVETFKGMTDAECAAVSYWLSGTSHAWTKQQLIDIAQERVDYHKSKQPA